MVSLLPFALLSSSLLSSPSDPVVAVRMLIGMLIGTMLLVVGGWWIGGGFSFLSVFLAEVLAAILDYVLGSWHERSALIGGPQKKPEMILAYDRITYSVAG